jgi:hypothetical protein
MASPLRAPTTTAAAGGLERLAFAECCASRSIAWRRKHEDLDLDIGTDMAVGDEGQDVASGKAWHHRLTLSCRRAIAE